MKIQRVTARKTMIDFFHRRVAVPDRGHVDREGGSWNVSRLRGVAVGLDQALITSSKEFGLPSCGPSIFFEALDQGEFRVVTSGFNTLA